MDRPEGSPQGGTTRTLLLVDDEENILRALRRVFRRDGYRILATTSPREALGWLEREPVGVIVSDQRMPEMSGVQFLSEVRERHPDTVRIVLSGYTELEAVTEAINRGAVYKFLTKPWDDELLRRNIAEAFRQYEMAAENARLARELRAANEELRRINEELEERVERKTRELAVNIRSLRIAQEVLEHLPVGVVGIDDEGAVVVANQAAMEHLAPGGVLVGLPAEAVLPAEAAELYRDFVADRRGTAVLADGSRLVASPMGPPEAPRGVVLVLLGGED
ncbi:response regulator [Inmirania thermothiophila]|uniref:Response regulator receiver domain-containing protein n=1 Tax=Inmirania thermothiophila TaxID=1750597 RepID=A0A3N1Y1L2_9GAMM|nr:response regulator [Inmirania thermothiophila]ROR32716.1 response regulator receiver domain-containing protein [Inmirania thermothiophila]